MIMNQDKQLPNELTSTFKELKMLKHLRKAGITKLSRSDNVEKTKNTY